MWLTAVAYPGIFRGRGGLRSYGLADFLVGHDWIIRPSSIENGGYSPTNLSEKVKTPRAKVFPIYRAGLLINRKKKKKCKYTHSIVIVFYFCKSGRWPTYEPTRCRSSQFNSVQVRSSGSTPEGMCPRVDWKVRAESTTKYSSSNRISFYKSHESFKSLLLTFLQAWIR